MAHTDQLRSKTEEEDVMEEYLVGEGRVSSSAQDNVIEDEMIA